MSIFTEDIVKGVDYNATTTDFNSLSDTEKATVWYAPTSAAILDKVSL